MGEMADYYMQQMMCEDYYEPSFCPKDKAKMVLDKYKEGTLSWTTRAGEEINVKDMTVLHLENTIKHLVNNSDDFTSEVEAWVDIFTKELNKRDKDG